MEDKKRPHQSLEGRVHPAKVPQLLEHKEGPPKGQEDEGRSIRCLLTPKKLLQHLQVVAMHDRGLQGHPRRTTLLQIDSSIPYERLRLLTVLFASMRSTPRSQFGVVLLRLHRLPLRSVSTSCLVPLILTHNISLDNDLRRLGDSAQPSQCCYTPFHLKCIKSWANKSLKDLRDAYTARGEPNRQVSWRCPGCQHARSDNPSSYKCVNEHFITYKFFNFVYRCFCGSTTDPAPPRIATPHSCGNPCSRTRVCGHPCPLSCHPGPCPPCQVMVHRDCHCGRERKAFRCADIGALGPDAAAPSADLSCGQPCAKMLNCGKHSCPSPCHAGSCAECPVIEASRCFCGKAEKPLKCGEGEEKDCAVTNGDGSLDRWVGRFECHNICNRYGSLSVYCSLF